MKRYSREALVLLGLTAVLAGCSSGDTDGGKGSDSVVPGSGYAGPQGALKILVNETRMSIADVSGFRVEVRGENNTPVENIRVTCDTEEGLALVEPTTGSEITDAFGNMSGKVGCAAPGSYQLGCRLPVGANKRQFVTIVCEGTVPSGFEGFPGSAGGGLGGGDDTDDSGGSGGTDSNGVRITSLQAYDEGDPAKTTTSIDTQQVDCDETAAVDFEPFHDSHLNFKVVNNTNQNVRFTHFNYTVSDADGSGRSFNSKNIALTEEGLVGAEGGTSEFSALFFDATAGGRKRFVDAPADIPLSLGFRNIRVRLYGSNDSGTDFVVSSSMSLSFDNFTRCP